MSSKALEVAIADLRKVNDQISKHETELASRTADLLAVCTKYRTALTTLYEQRTALDDVAYKAFAEECGAGKQRADLAALDKLTTLLRDK